MFSKVQGHWDQITIVPCAEKLFQTPYWSEKSGYYLCECGAHYILPDICRVSQMRESRRHGNRNWRNMGIISLMVMVFCLHAFFISFMYSPERMFRRRINWINFQGFIPYWSHSEIFRRNKYGKIIFHFFPERQVFFFISHYHYPLPGFNSKKLIYFGCFSSPISSPEPGSLKSFAYYSPSRLPGDKDRFKGIRLYVKTKGSVPWSRILQSLLPQPEYQFFHWLLQEPKVSNNTKGLKDLVSYH